MSTLSESIIFSNQISLPPNERAKRIEKLLTRTPHILRHAPQYRRRICLGDVDAVARTGKLGEARGEGVQRKRGGWELEGWVSVCRPGSGRCVGVSRRVNLDYHETEDEKKDEMTEGRITTEEG